MFKRIVTAFVVVFLCFLASAPVHASKSVQLDFFWSNGCPHCAKEKVFLDELKDKYPNLTINSYEISQNMGNALLLQSVGQRLNVDVSGVPFTVIGDEYIVGFGSGETTGKQIEELILAVGESSSDATPLPIEASNKPLPVVAISQTPVPIVNSQKQAQDRIKDTSIDIPLLGSVKVSQFSLPVLTFLIALVDGFNPCAMWTLLFLISLLIGMKNRKRMWVLGIAFIAASALVYFLFLSAWLNLFLFIGMLGWVRMVIALVALGAAFIYLKKYWQHKTGCEIMGDEKRQKVFEKLRSITTKQSFAMALVGIVLLAFAVNMVELLCSAGLPAIYTKVLSMYQLPGWQYYGYLLFYILVFMFDDLFIFFTAMLTLQVTGIQSKYTHASQLIGGLLMLIIGLLLLLKPELLMFG